MSSLKQNRAGNAAVRGYFITGTDTHVGKTVASLALMSYLQRQGQRVVGMKPIASGCVWNNNQWVNDDALKLQQQSSLNVSYEQVNPYAFELPVSPNIAAQKSNQVIEFDRIKAILEQLQECSDRVVVEGVGGWLVPIDRHRTVGDMAACLNLPVILIVGLQLGCINHAVLTYKAIQQQGVNCKGWIANHRETGLLCHTEVVATIKYRLPIPLLGEIPLLEDGLDINQIDLDFQL